MKDLDEKELGRRIKYALKKRSKVPTIAKNLGISEEEVERIAMIYARRYIKARKREKIVAWQDRLKSGTIYNLKQEVKKWRTKYNRRVLNERHSIKVKGTFSDNVIVKDLKYNYLKYLFPAVKYVCKKFKLDENTLFFLLYAYDMKPQRGLELMDVINLYDGSTNDLRFRKMINDGWISKWEHSDVWEGSRFILSRKGIEVVEFLYDLIQGTRKFPERKSEKEMFRRDFRLFMSKINKRDA